MGIQLEGKSVSAAFENLREAVKSFAGLSYAKISEVKPQWPIVGRGDMYYGGTTYENTMGLGAHLTAAAQGGETVSIPQVQTETAPRPKENELLAVPVTKLYDRGTTVMMSANLLRERIGSPSIALHPESRKESGSRRRSAGEYQFRWRKWRRDRETGRYDLGRRGVGAPRDGSCHSWTCACRSTRTRKGGMMLSDWTLWLEWFIKALVVIFALLTGFAYLTWYERRALARIQSRIGPNRAGPFGLLQPIADAVKLIFKEELNSRPGRSDHFLLGTHNNAGAFDHHCRGDSLGHILHGLWSQYYTLSCRYQCRCVVFDVDCFDCSLWNCAGRLVLQ